MMKTVCAIFALFLAVTLAGGQYSVDAAPKNPFLKLKGSWKGKGNVKPKDGQPERVSCRVKYDVKGGGTNVTQNINCAGSGYWIKARTSFKYTPGSQRIDGTWSASYGDKSDPKKRSTTGEISGSYINDVIAIDLDSEDYSGGMTIRMSGRTQEVTIGSLAKLTLTR
ncbi:MAG: hypothetical protein AAF228_00910 [Pseudomonadota bacterium]